MGAGATKAPLTNPSLDSKPSASVENNITKCTNKFKEPKQSSRTPTSKTEAKPSLDSKQSLPRVKNKTTGNRTAAKKTTASHPSSTSTSKTTMIKRIDHDTCTQLYMLPYGSDIHRPVTAAIDFGTTSSGFAFVFEDKPNNVHVNKWVSGTSEKEKAPTTVLLKEDKTFCSFGYTAEEDYARLCENGEQKGWRYFHLFKMALYRNDKLSRNTDLYDVENKPMPALGILSIVICYLKKKILEAIRLQRRGVSDDDVMYVITVPAIWSDAAKQLIREAATCGKAGIHNDQLRLVLEPEAASVYCSGQRVVKRRSGGGSGTLDMATHEIIADGRLHEKHVARGNDKGGHYFNKKVLEFLEKLFGQDCFRQWKTTECGDFLDLERDVEEIIRKVGKRKDDVKLNIRPTLLELYRESTGGEDIDILETKKEFSNAIFSANCKKCFIILKNSFLKELIKQTAVAIETYLATIIKDDTSVMFIFLVGGLAKSPFVRQYIESRFPYCRVVVPEDAGVAVLKGAVQLGNRPQTIASRLARYTYGINFCPFFIPGVYSEEYKFTRDGEELCLNAFLKLIEKDEVLQYGQRFTTTTYVSARLPETKQLSFTSYLYQSSQASPMYVSEDGCSQLGGFELLPPEGGWPDYCEQKVELIVGEAEFKLELSDDLGRKYETKIDFLLPSK